MKLSQVIEGVVDFPLDRRGLEFDEITGRWLPKQEPTEEYIVADDRYAYSTHPTYKEAELAMKKLKLKGKKVHIIPV